MVNSRLKVGRAGKVGVSLAAATVAAAGAYYFYGPRGALHRRQLRQRVSKAKKQIARQVENVNDFSRRTYNQIVSQVKSGYKNIKKTDRSHLRAAIDELDQYWRELRAAARRAR